MSLTLYQKLEKIKLCEEGILKAKIGQEKKSASLGNERIKDILV